MAREIPEVVRAVAGLAAILLDEARKLPETLPGLPVRIIGLAMQQAMKVQHRKCRPPRTTRSRSNRAPTSVASILPSRPAA